MMNKYKKIATAVVATVMAGTMVASLAACNPNGPDNGDGPGSSGSTSTSLLKLPDLYDVVNDKTGDINYGSYARNGVTLNLGIGHNNAETSTTFKSLGSQVKLPDGVLYEDGKLKPAWAAMGNDLNITFNDVWGASKDYQTSSNIKNMLANSMYAGTDLFTTDLAQAVSYANSGTSILNLANYLDYMPHFTAFLNQNPVVYLSLLQAGMSTTDGSGKTLYVAPYFDGNDDIERYCIIRQDWAEKLLNGNGELTGTTTLGVAPKAQAYLGKTGQIAIESSDGTGATETVNGATLVKKITITKDYDAVVNALKATSSNALKTAYEDITQEAYAGTSGNIVDVMNAALAKNAEATGNQLTKLFRAYIDVCYGGHYTADKRANLFNGYDACWDVDDLVAILRCVKASGTALTNKTIYGIAPRDGTNDRTPDMVRLAAQLYGVRGADSRYENIYIDNSGDLQDARNDKEFYEAFANMNLLKQEGLIADYSTIADFKNAAGLTTTSETFLMYDYSQTQTLNGFYAEDSSLTGVDTPDDYYFAPIITPVAKWDVDGDGNHTDIMRFTESWRSVKSGGLALNGALANAGNEDKLKAALQFVDYLYSADGQIVSTYGPQASDANSTGGFWYNAEATADEVSAGKYFTFKGKKYSGSDYKGKTTPTITTNVYSSFKGKKVNGYDLSQMGKVSSAKLSFTSYARMLIGSTLPVGIKDQSFENQLTSLMGQTGASKVGAALANGTVKGMTLDVNENTWWYTCVPTGLPIASNYVAVLDASDMSQLKYMTGTNKNGKNWYNIYNYIILFGTNGTYNQQDQQLTFTSIDNLLTQMSTDLKAQVRENAFRTGWNNAKNYWEYLSSAVGSED